MNKQIKYIGIVALTLALVVAGSYVIKFICLPISNEPEKWGPFGDYIGGILNPVFGFGSLIALLYTLNHQIDQSDKAEKSYTEQKKLLEGQLSFKQQEIETIKQGYDDQKQLFDQQNFETTFFNLLNTLVIIDREVLTDEKCKDFRLNPKATLNTIDSFCLGMFDTLKKSVPDNFIKFALVTHAILQHINIYNKNQYKYIEILIIHTNKENLEALSHIFILELKRTLRPITPDDYSFDKDILNAFLKVACKYSKDIDNTYKEYLAD